MKRDAIIAFAIILIVAGVTFGLGSAKLDLKPITPPPGSVSSVSSPSASGPVTGHVIMRVNGEPITEEEFAASFSQLPEDMQRQLANPQGKTAFAEQLVRYKLLEQEARRMGIDRDLQVSGTVDAARLNILASAAAQKIIPVPNEQAINDYYKSNHQMFESVDLSHIVLAYGGGMVPPRGGKNPPAEEVAMAQAKEIVARLRGGANFAQTAAQYSDDTASAAQGGELGMVAHGSLPPEIEGAVFSLKDGQISDPVSSRFGVHIFMVRKHGAQPLDQVRPAITAQVRNQSMLQRVESLRKTAKVDFDPKFFPKKPS